MAKEAVVSLTIPELWEATSVGTARALFTYQNASKDQIRDGAMGWRANINTHILGAMGEIAAAKYLDGYYSASFNTFKREPDLKIGGYSIEVRTRQSTWQDLIVRKTDDGDSIYVLACVPGDWEDSQIWLRGWILGSHALSMDDCLQTHGGMNEAYFIPVGRIHPMQDLYRITRALAKDNEK